MLEYIQTLFSQSKTVVGFEDVKYAAQLSLLKTHPCGQECISDFASNMRNCVQLPSADIIIINTLSNLEQSCLISGTIPYDKEEITINNLLENSQTMSRIILYGKNSADESINKKHKQLSILGFTNVYIYVGGLFEWLLLQDIYGQSEFPTTSICRDILKYRPPPKFSYLFES